MYIIYIYMCVIYIYIYVYVYVCVCTHVYVLRAPAMFQRVVLPESLTFLRPSAFLTVLHFLNY